MSGAYVNCKQGYAPCVYMLSIKNKSKNQQSYCDDEFGAL